jgi:KilA-N domain
MRNQKMSVDIMGEVVFATTDGYVSLTSLCEAGNMWRGANRLSTYQLPSFMGSKLLKDYIAAATKIWDLPEESFVKVVGKGRAARTWGHISIAILLAEQLSPEFHVSVHKIFIEGRILEYRLLGGDEFKTLNAAIAQYIPSPTGDNTGRYIQTAKMLKEKCKLQDSPDKEIDTWNQSRADSVIQKMRYDLEAKIVGILQLGLIRDWDHLKEVIAKL